VKTSADGVSPFLGSNLSGTDDRGGTDGTGLRADCANSGTNDE